MCLGFKNQLKGMYICLLGKRRINALAENSRYVRMLLNSVAYIYIVFTYIYAIQVFQTKTKRIGLCFVWK